MGSCEQCIVRQFSSLKALSKEELLKVASCKSSFRVKKGENLFEEGQYANGVFCIKSGICKISKLTDNGKSHIVKLITKGELLAQHSLINDESVNLTPTALVAMDVCFIPKSFIMSFFHTTPHFSMVVLKPICEDLKQADNDILNMAKKRVRVRLALPLLYLAIKFATDEEKVPNVQLSREKPSGMV